MKNAEVKFEKKYQEQYDIKFSLLGERNNKSCSNMFC